MEQQIQTQKYFGSEAERWDAQAKKLEYNTIMDRNNTVLDSLRRHGGVTNFLDVGCGTGQLTIQIADLGIAAVGIDFASEMIDICHKIELPLTQPRTSTAPQSLISNLRLTHLI